MINIKEGKYNSVDDAHYALKRNGMVLVRSDGVIEEWMRKYDYKMYEIRVTLFLDRSVDLHEYMFNLRQKSNPEGTKEKLIAFMEEIIFKKLKLGGNIAGSFLMPNEAGVSTGRRKFELSFLDKVLSESNTFLSFASDHVRNDLSQFSKRKPSSQGRVMLKRR